MNRCFVIQPFDRGPFDKRFDDVLAPAIKEAGLEPYRVDRDPTVTVPIEAIEAGIRDADACIADVTTNNPNVWFELGFALACGKPVVLICASERESKFPFDIQHRHITTYRTDSTRDFEKLHEEVRDRLGAALKKESHLKSLSEATLKETEGLEPHEIAALVIIAESDLDPNAFPSANALKEDMNKAGYTEIATVLAVRALRAKKLVTSTEVPGSGYNESYTAYCLLDGGTEWLMMNRDKLVLTRKSPAQVSTRVQDFEDFPGALADEDDLPF